MIFIRKILFFGAIIFLLIGAISFFFPALVLNINIDKKLDFINILLSFIGSFTGILISAYLIVFSVAGNNPYSRLKKSLYNKYDSYIFLYLLLFIIFIIFSLINLEKILLFHLSLLFYGAIVSTLLIFYIIFKQIELLDDENIVKSSLNIFSKKNILAYNLVAINNDNIGINSWLDNNGTLDPLGGFNEIIQGNLKDRILLKTYLFLFNNRIDKLIHKKIFKVESHIQLKILTHGLHYIIRLSKKIKNELKYDVFRKVFLNIILDLIIKVLKNKKSELELIKLKLLFYSFVKVNLEYSDIEFYGNGDPIIDFIKLKNILQINGYYDLIKVNDLIIKFLDRETKYISKSGNKEILKYIPKDFKKIELKSSIDEIFENKINIGK